MAAINEQLDNEGASLSLSGTINKLDLVSIEAMISYTANRVHADMPFIQRAVLNHFKVTDLKKLTRAQSEAAIKYLTDYRVAANAR